MKIHAEFSTENDHCARIMQSEVLQMRNKKEKDILPERKSVLTDEERALAGARRKFIRKQKRMRRWTRVLCVILAGYLAIGAIGLVTVKIMYILS